MRGNLSTEASRGTTDCYVARPARAGFYAAPRNAPRPLEGSSSR